MPKQHAQRGAARERRQPRSVALLAVGVAVAAVWAVAWLLDGEHLPIAEVDIEGTRRGATERSIREGLTGVVDTNFLRVDVETVKTSLEALPWIAQANVRRVWPDRLEVRVVEQQPMARWGDAELLNERGELFTPEPGSLPPGLPMLIGPEGHEETVLRRYLGMSRLLRDTGLRIVRLEFDERRAWSLQLDNDLVIELGRALPEQRLQRLVRVFSRELLHQGRQMEQVDLRYPNGFAVRWKVQPVSGTG